MSENPIAAASSSAYEALKPALRRFVDLYLAGEKATNVMRQIRPTLKRPDVLASKWLALPAVKAAIAERRQNLLEAAGIHQEMIVRELGRIAFGDPLDLEDEHGNPLPLRQMSADARAMIAGVEYSQRRIRTGEGESVTTQVIKRRRWDKRQALRDLAAIGGLDKSDGESGGSTIFNIQINL